MTATATFKQADLKRALVAVQSAGLPITKVTIDRLGQIVIQTDQTQPTGKVSEWDDHVKTLYSRTT